MIRILLLSLALQLSVQYIQAQELKYPLADKETKLDIPVAPSENLTWVKAHWEFVNGNYVWMPGVFIENLEFHEWREGYWERNQKTGWWVYNPGYWQRVKGDMKFQGEDSYSNNLTTEPIKPQGLFINKADMVSK